MQFRHIAVALLLVPLAFVTHCPGGLESIANGVGGDGTYQVSVDEYGSIADRSYGGGGDSFDPVGPQGPVGITFSNGLFLTVGNTHRELLTSNTIWPNNNAGFDGNADFTLTHGIINANQPDDTNNDGVFDTTSSSFGVTGAGVDLTFDLEQTVTDGSVAGTARYTRNYVVTNNGPDLTFKLTLSVDGDLAFDGGNFHLTDQVGVGTLSGQKYVIMQEVGDISRGMSIWSPQAHTYAGSKKGLLPTGGGTPYTVGSGPAIWDHYGLPADWINDIPTVGKNVDGLSNPLLMAQDASVYLEWEIDLSTGESTNIDIITAMGEIVTASLLPSDLNSNGFVDFEDLTILLANWNKDVTAADGNLVEPLVSVVNFADLTVLLADWTGPGPAGAPAAALGEAVPEPSTLLLALLATLGISVCGRRRRRDR